jgi:uncharacterized membrane protein
VSTRIESAMSTGDTELRAEARREAAPAVVLVLVVLAALALTSRAEGWELLGLPWWIWLVLGLPAFLLTVDLLLALRGKGLVQSRRAAIVLLALLASGNFAALMILVAGLVTANTSDLSGGELLLTGFAIYTTDLVVFGLIFWEVEAGGPMARLDSDARDPIEFRFPQDDDKEAGWKPRVWDYLYVSLTNSIAFSPTDTMPLSLRAKALMGLESFIAAVTVLLVAARAVNVLGS